MLFNSFGFLIFFVVVTALFYLLKHRFRWILLLAASCFFYMFFKPVYILILAFTIIIDYFAGIAIEGAIGKSRKRGYLVLSLVANIGILAIFKYFNFINGNITGFSKLLGYHNNIPYLKILLPIGLSFHTFQAMSYTIEIYRGNQKAETHFGIYSLYVMFYPQLVAGPIERPQNLLNQFREKKTYLYYNVVTGLRLMLWGFFKKVVIADRLAVIVNEVYKNYLSYNGLALLTGVIFFAFQIYADFSGYSDIARGTAKVMGYDLMLNFNYPFRSKNFTEFWRRWHISLSTWFNDYLYTPIVLAKRNWGKFAVVYAILITFCISGLWHGAGWTFIVFGLLHGIALAYEFLSRKFRKRLSKKIPQVIYNPVSQLITFLFLVFTWIFFRSENFNKAASIIKRLFFFDDSYKKLLNQALAYHFFMGLVVIALLECSQKIFAGYQVNEYLEKQNIYARWSFYIIVSVLIFNFGIFGSNQFIYFQF